MHLDSYGRCHLASWLCAACARGRSRAPSALGRHAGAAFVTSDYAELLARTDIDVVDLCVPPVLHHEFAIRAAQAGKHLMESR